MEVYESSYHQVIIIEEENYNNTLAPWNACNNANGPIYEMGSWYQGNWTDVYLKDTVKRLQRDLIGVELNTDIVYAMQEMCAYETVSIGYSRFCDLFTEEEWKGFEYSIGMQSVARRPVSKGDLTEWAWNRCELLVRRRPG